MIRFQQLVKIIKRRFNMNFWLLINGIVILYKCYIHTSCMYYSMLRQRSGEPIYILYNTLRCSVFGQVAYYNIMLIQKSNKIVLTARIFEWGTIKKNVYDETQNANESKHNTRTFAV